MPVVRRTNFKLPWKIVTVGRKAIKVGMSCCIGPGDRILFGKNGTMFAKCLNGLARVLPPYRARDTIWCGHQQIRIGIKEITNEEEYSGYQQLAEFHYRNRGARGRHAILVATTRDPVFPKVIGYIELTTSFFMNKARSIVFDTKFDSGNGIRWQKWNAQVAREQVNSVVRIARCVVYPEFRGLGLGQVLVNHSFRFARKHWHLAGVRPCFVEIIADMLKFIPFAAKAGMVYIGNTEGNLSRVRRDLEYLLKNARRIAKGDIIRVRRGKNLEDPQGIVDLQLDYARRVQRMLKSRRIGIDRFLANLERVGSRPSMKLYEEFREILRFPKPTYMRGLTAKTQRFLTQRVEELGIKEVSDEPPLLVERLASPIRLESVTVTFRSSVRRTRKTQAIQQAFGLSPKDLEFTVLKEFSVQIPPGSVVLCVGASGSGKSVLLDLLVCRGHPRRQMVLEGSIGIPRNARVGVFRELDSSKPLVELIGKGSVARSIRILNMAGLSEAYIYLKRFKDLSKGQQYRAMIAKILDSDANLWIADEFCSSLDLVTANIVAANVRRYAKKTGATVVLAAAHFAGFIHSLQPDLVIQLTNAWEYDVRRGDQFLRRLDASALHPS